MPVAALTVTQNQALGFGAFVAGSVPGTVRVSAAGERTHGGGVIVLNQANPGGMARAATFTLSGGPRNRDTCTIVLTGHPDTPLTRTGAGMALTAFTSFPAGQITLDAQGGGRISVGATLAVNAHQSAGEYGAAAFSLDVICP